MIPRGCFLIVASGHRPLLPICCFLLLPVLLAIVLLSVPLTLLASGPPAGTLSDSEWVTDPVQVERVTFIRFDSEVVGEQVSFHIYLPDAYHLQPNARFPVVYWLHGGAENTTGGIPFMAGHFNNAITNGDAPPMIVVFPHGRPFGMWLNSKDGRSPVESLLMDDLIPLVDEKYRTLNQAGGRLVEGWSMGGYGAARLGMRYYERFAGLSMLGAGPVRLDFFDEDVPLLVPLQRRKAIFDEIFGNDTTFYVEQNPWHIAEQMAGELPDNFPVRIAVGTDDPMIIDNRMFSAHLNRLGISHSYLEIPDVAHQAVAVRQYLAMNDPDFYTRVFGDVLKSTLDSEGPEGFRLLPNYPNPFNPKTTLAYELGYDTGVHIEVFDVTGRLVDRLDQGRRAAGRNETVFHAHHLSSGVYLYRVFAGEVVLNGQMLLVK